MKEVFLYTILVIILCGIRLFRKLIMIKNHWTALDVPKIVIRFLYDMLTESGYILTL